MKNQVIYLLFVIALAISPKLRAQEKFDATGVWTGQIYNDSTKNYIPFELAVSQKNGVFSGYSYTVFVIDSIENIGVKEITIKEKDGKFIVRDKKLIDDNYTDKPAKGVYTTIELEHSQNDTADVFSGRWYTNKTKEFYPLSGTVFLTKKRRVYETRIVQRLSYLGLANTLSFTRPSQSDEVTVRKEPETKQKDNSKEEPMMTVVEPELVISLPKKDSSKNITLPKIENLLNIADSAKRPTTGIVENSAKTGEKVPATAEVEKNSVAQNTENVVREQKVEVTANTVGKVRGDSAIRRILTKEDSVINAHATNDNTAKTISISDTLKKPAVKNPVAPKVIAVPADLVNRKIETIRSVNIVNDSIIISLFDNGAIDGDTVSVLLNDKVIISKVGLLARAYNHTIHLTPEMGDSLKLILYAENLGSIPPNTGLLVVRDGDKDYEIRFSGDLQKNSAIILRRNKKE